MGDEIVFSLEELMEMADFFKINGDLMRNQLGDLRSSLGSGLLNLDWYSGSAVAVNNIVRNDHIPMIKAFDNAYFKMGVKTRDLNTSFRNQMDETADNAMYSEGALNVFEQAMLDAYNDVEHVDEEFREIYMRVRDTFSLDMPSNNPFMTDWEECVRELARTRTSLVEFSFDLDDIEALVDDIERYVGKIETAAGTPLGSRGPVLSEGFRRDMLEMHVAIADYEEARVQELLASWLGRHPYDILEELPHPMTTAEQLAWTRYVLSVVEGLGSCEAMNSFWSHLPSTIRDVAFEEAIGWLITRPAHYMSQTFAGIATILTGSGIIMDAGGSIIRIFRPESGFANRLQDLGGRFQRGGSSFQRGAEHLGRAARYGKWIQTYAFPAITGILAAWGDYSMHGEPGMALAHGTAQAGWAVGYGAVVKPWVLGLKIAGPKGWIALGIYVGGSILISSLFDRDSSDSVDWEELEELWGIQQIGEAFCPAS